MDEDMNSAAALGHAFELARAVNRLSNHKKARTRAGPIARRALEAFRIVESIGLLRLSTAAFQAEVKRKRLAASGISEAHINALLQRRQDARAEKAWADADALRQELEQLGVVVMDRGDSVEWRVRV
jgi:cysteinyl-tRNA synthetase